MGVKGSLKDRIRFWNSHRIQKKKEREKREYEELLQFQKEKQKQGVYIQIPKKKYSKIQNLISIFLGFCFSLFTFNKKTEKSRKEEQLLDEIILLQKEGKQLSSYESIQFYHQKVEQKEKQIIQIKNPQIVLECNKHIEQIKQTIQEHKTLFESSTIFPPPKKQNVISSNTKEQNKKNFPSIHQKSEKKGKQQLEKPKIHVEIEEVQKPIKQESIQKIKYTTINQTMNNNNDIRLENEEQMDITQSIGIKKYLVEANQNLKQKKKDIQKVKEEMKQVKSEEELYQLKMKLFWIQYQLRHMESAYQEISKNKEFTTLKNKVEYYQIDDANLLKNNDMIEKLFVMCEQLLENKNIKEQPEVSMQKVESKQEKPKEEQSTFYLDVEDFQTLRAKILEDMHRQMRELNEIPLPTKIPLTGFFQKVVHFISNMAVAILPTSIFKNKLIGALTSSIIMHNRIRSMKKHLTQEQVVYEFGENLFQTIKSKQDCLRAIEMHMTSSLYELEQLKQDFIHKYQAVYPTEVDTILMQFQFLENQIIEQATWLQMHQQILLRTKQKYQKILKKEK